MGELSLQRVSRFLRQKEKLVVNPQYRYDMRHVVMSLNNSCIDHIKREFRYNDNRLDLNKFLWLMRQALDEPQQESHIICYELVKLFEEIDIDNSNTIEWTQFLEYLSQSNWLAAPSSKVAFNSKDSSLLVHAFHEEAKYRKHTLRKIIELPRHNSLALLAHNHSLSFLSYDRSKNKSEFKEEENSFSLNHIDPNRVLSIDYSQEERLFGVLLTNRNLCFVQDGEMQKNYGVMRSSGTEVEIRYLPLHKLWILENVNSTIQIFTSPKSSSLASKIVFRPHQQPITAIREVGSPLTLCTASLDGMLKLWQVASGRLIIELDVRKQRNDEEKKGVKGMATYNRGVMTFICTWMFTTEIFLWLPSLSLSKPFAGQLQGHLGLVQDCAFAWRGELISLDDKRSVRVWNPQRLECLQCFTIGEENCSLMVLRAQPYLITFSRLLNFFRIRTNSKADLQSQVGSAGKDGKNVLAIGQGLANRLISVTFSPYYCLLIVVSSQDIKILDINNIQPIASQRPPSSSEFISATMKGTRRICVATSLGIVQQRKVEDGQAVRSIDVCENSDLQELKLIYYHQETKILLALVESATDSRIITYDMQVGESQRVKEIDFDQTGLLDLKFFQASNRFFVLSSDPCVTVWDYDKLSILNRIDLQIVAKPILSGTVRIIAEPINNCLLVQTGKGICLLYLDYSGSVSNVTLLQLHSDLSEPQIAAAALLLEKIPMSYLEQEKAKKTKREMQFEGKKKVDFKMFQQQEQRFTGNELFEEIFVLAVANYTGEVFYYKVPELLRTLTLEQSAPLRGKAQRVKEHRRAHMKNFSWSGKTTTVSCAGQKVSEQYSFAANIETGGSALGLFYFHTEDNLLYFFTPYAEMRGEWTLSLPKPKNWNIAYNQIEEVLTRLEKTQLALQEIYHHNPSRFKVDFLIAKYLCQEEVVELKRMEESQKRDVKSVAAFSQKKLASKKSMVSINDNLAGQLSEKSDLIQPTHPLFKKSAENVFEKKLQENYKRKLVHRNSKDLFQKVQRSLSQSKQVQQQQNTRPNFREKPFHAVDSLLHTDYPLTNSSVKSVKKTPSNTQVNFQQVRPQTNAQLFRSRSSKNRIKSSIGQLCKNFTAGKIEWHNFKKCLQEGNQGLLQKRGKLKL